MQLEIIYKDKVFLGSESDDDLNGLKEFIQETFSVGDTATFTLLLASGGCVIFPKEVLKECIFRLHP